MSKFDKVIGYESIKTELKRFSDVLKSPEKYSLLGVKNPSGVLLYGEPGIGKSLMAKCFIEESGCKCITLRKEKPNGDFVDAIRSTYEKAKEEGIRIVFLDDMDKFANEDRNHPNAEEYVTIQSCIDEYKESGIFTLATANDIDCIPESLLRSGRFDKDIHMGTPKRKDAAKIIKHYLSQLKTVGSIDSEELADILDGRSCADLEMVVNEAGIYAGYESRDKITQNDLIRASRRLFFSVPECPEYDKNAKYAISTAYHEAGHAIVSEILMPESVALISLNGDFAYNGGVTKYKAIDEQYSFSEHIHYRVMRALGGKAAIEVIYGEADNGCISDLEVAFGMMGRLMDDCCAYGLDTYSVMESSEYRRAHRDNVEIAEMNRLYELTKKIIIDNRPFLEALKEELLNKRLLTCNDVQKIKKKSLG